MQTISLKKTLCGFIWLMACSNAILAQNAGKLLIQADTLFNRKQYTESLQVYEQIIEQTGQITPGMLLRMAFIQEGLGDYTKALYYLNLYYVQVPRPSVAMKMAELAERHNLSGYQFSDIDFFFIWYDRYYTYLIAAILLISLWLLIAVTRKKIKGRFVPMRHGAGLLLILLLNVGILNLRFNDTKAIIAQDSAYLMSAPSAGAKLVRIVRKGNRLDVYGRQGQDIWLKTEWNGQPAYVRQYSVLLVQ